MLEPPDRRWIWQVARVALETTLALDSYGPATVIMAFLGWYLFPIGFLDPKVILYVFL